MTKVSIVITNYNYGKYLGRCIRSCADQSVDKSEYEIILVDDGSNDNSLNVASAYSEHLRIFETGGRKGVAFASNYGIKKALNPLIVRVDADDYINRNLLLFMSEILMWNPGIGFVYCDHLVVDSEEKVIGRINLDTVDKLFKHGAGVMFRKSYLETIGLYDVDIKNAEDFDLLARYFKNFDGYRLRIPLYRYFKHQGSLSSEKDRIDWIEEVKDKNKLHGVEM